MEERIGFVGIVLDDLSAAPKVNTVISRYQDLVTGRIGIPDHQRESAVIGLIVCSSPERVGQMTGQLGNIPGVTVKSALTGKRKTPQSNTDI